jgi:hypothetical protein
VAVASGGAGSGSGTVAVVALDALEQRGQFGGCFVGFE